MNGLWTFGNKMCKRMLHFFQIVIGFQVSKNLKSNSVQTSYPQRGTQRECRRYNLLLSEALGKHMDTAGNSFKIINEKRHFQLVVVKRSELHLNHLRSVVSKLFKSSEMGVQHHPWEIITLVGGRCLCLNLRKFKPLVSACFPMTAGQHLSFFF